MTKQIQSKGGFLLFSLLLTLIFACSFVCIEVSANDKTVFSGGSGTEDDPYIVSTAADFLNVKNSLSSYFVQVGDISLSDVEYEPIGSYEKPFTGTYNGNGFFIKGISSSVDDAKYIGTFAYSEGTIVNVKLKESSFTVLEGTDIVYCGALVGYNRGTVSSCTVDATVDVSTKGEGVSAYSGGICGRSTTTIEDCGFYGTVTTTLAYIGSNAYSGGIVATGNAKDCANYGEINAIATISSSALAGGISASAYTVSNCYNKGDITAKNATTAYAGGIVGGNSYAVSGCKNDGNVYANTKYSYSETYSGGISGHNDSTISYCQNFGNVDADSTSSHVRVGGIAGYNDGTVKKSRNYGTITGYSTTYEAHIGGIAGTTGCTSGVRVESSCNYGKVEVSGNGPYSVGSAGGVTGLLQYGTAIQCCNHGEVSGKGNDDNLSCYVGGVVGATSGATIVDCYNTGNVTFDYTGDRDWNAGACGGVYGESDAVCAYCYNVGTLVVTSELSEIGGVQGLGNSNSSDILEYCYALNVYQDPHAIKMTDAESKVKATYVGFDFENVWDIAPNVNNGRPYLVAVPGDDDPNWYSEVAVSITLNFGEMNLGVGKQKTLSVSGVSVDEELVWKTSDESIVSVNNGVVKGIKLGTAVVIVSTVDEKSIASCLITVVEKETFSISGCVSGMGTDNETVTVQLLNGNIVLKSLSVLLSGGTYKFDGLDSGTYIIRVGEGDDAKDYTVTINEVNVIQDLITGMYGDPSGDGKVNVRDAAMILQYLAGWSVEIAEDAADVNCDGKVNVRDAAMILQYLAGWDVTLGQSS